MAVIEKPRATQKVQNHRARMRAAGLRPVQMWVPDLRSAAVRQAILRTVKDSKFDKIILAEQETMADWPHG